MRNSYMTASVLLVNHEIDSTLRFLPLRLGNMRGTVWGHAGNIQGKTAPKNIQDVFFYIFYVISISC